MSQTLLTVDEVAARLSCHPHTVRRWIWSHRLKAVKVGELVRVPEDEVTRLMRPIEKPQNLSGKSTRKGPAALLELMRVLENQIVPEDVEQVERAVAEARQPTDWADVIG